MNQTPLPSKWLEVNLKQGPFLYASMYRFVLQVRNCLLPVQHKYSLLVNISFWYNFGNYLKKPLTVQISITKRLLQEVVFHSVHLEIAIKPGSYKNTEHDSYKTFSQYY